MKPPSIIYRSERIGKNGKPFSLYKIRTMRVGVKTQFADTEVYTRYGRLLRKLKIDELPQLWNVLKGDINIVGYRPDFQETYDVLPDHIKQMYYKHKPGLTSLASIHFADEEELLQGQEDKYANYWGIVKPTKILLDTFYNQHRDIFLDMWIVWKTIILIVKKLFTK